MTGPFLGVEEGGPTAYADAAAVVVPVPYERTVSYGGGTAGGPAAILAASAYVELWDEVLGEEPWRKGIHTASEVAPVDDPEIFLASLESRAREIFADGKFPVFLGGEHALTTAPVRAAREAFEGLSVLQLDAHADLRQEYMGTPWSHASVMRRIHDLGVHVVPVGIRAVSPEEMRFIRAHDLPVFWSHRIAYGDEWIDTALSALTETVYLTFDVDFFDPSMMPSTGTPEPGGGFWHDTMRFLGYLFQEKRVVGMDVVELAPIDGLHAPNFVIARLVYRAIGYHLHEW